MFPTGIITYVTQNRFPERLEAGLVVRYRELGL